MADKRAGGIFASALVAGVLLAGAVFAPRAWEPVPGPFFGLDDRAAAPAKQPIDVGIEAAHVELSARAQPRLQPATAPRRPVAPESAPATWAPATAPPVQPPATPSVEAARTTAFPRGATDVEGPRGPMPPERLASNVNAGPADAAATASVLSSTAGAASGAAPIAPEAAAAAPEPPHESLKALATRRQSAAKSPAAPPTPPPQAPAVPVPQSWSQAAPSATLPSAAALSASGGLPAPQPRGLPLASEPPAAAPLPGEPWTDPDGMNWSDVIANPPLDAERRRTWIGDWRAEHRSSTAASRSPDPRGSPSTGGARLLERLRGSERKGSSSQTGDAAGTLPAAPSPPDIGQWPRLTRLEQQFDHLSTLATGAAGGGEPIIGWIGQTRLSLRGVQETRGPRDAAADASLIVLGESVIEGMTLAERSPDGTLATHTRRTALAVSRRVAVWRGATALFAAVTGSVADLDPTDAAAAMARQAAGRTVVEVARLLDGLERFELAPTAGDAAHVRTALASIVGFYPAASRGLLRAVEDHYLAPNVRIAVHQRFLDSLLPAATIDTGPFQDVVMGREVRGTRTVERTTNVRLVPDDDEISLHLEVHGDIASRAITDAGPVSVTSRSASAFSVRKPIKISSQGLLFGNAVGTATNRSHVDNIQTSFDAVPVMGSVVRNIARSQQADAMPEANREVIDKIVSRACREVDSQSEPQFAEMADRVREKIWMPLVNLGLQPKAVAMETTSAVATMRLRVAGEEQLAAHTPRPRAPADALLSLQVHESSANNAFERLGLAGRRQTLEELIVLVCSQIGVEPRIPDELPENVAVTFAETHPLRVECRDGLVHVQVALDAIESGRRDWYDVVAHVAYRPVCSGPQVYLEREGPVQLRGPAHEGRIELALRTIFGKIFPKERRIPLLPAKITENPQLEGVEAVQSVSSDGWLAMTLERHQEPPPTIAAPKRPADRRPAEARRKMIRR